MTPSIKETLCLAVNNTHFSPNYFSGIKLVVSLNGCFDCEVNGKQLRGLTGLMLNRNIQHTLSTGNASLLMYYIDCHSDWESYLDNQLASQSWLDISQQVNALSVPNWVASTLSASLAVSLNALARQLLAALFPVMAQIGDPIGNERSEQLMGYINEHIQSSISLEHMATLLSLSVERTRHVIEERLGMPFSQYVLWVRLKLVIQAGLNQKEPMSRTALQWGFADQSHFNRRFKRFFGTSPNRLLNCQDDNQFLLV